MLRELSMQWEPALADSPQGAAFPENIGTIAVNDGTYSLAPRVPMGSKRTRTRDSSNDTMLPLSNASMSCGRFASSVRANQTGGGEMARIAIRPAAEAVLVPACAHPLIR